VIKSRLGDGAVLVGFELPAAVSATSVSVCGDFNDWSPQQHPLSLASDGTFVTYVPLSAGRRWRFRYLLDGERWENDWAADGYEPNGLGSDDSVVDLTDVSSLPITATVSTDPAERAGSAGIEEAAANGRRRFGAPGAGWFRRLIRRPA
jgi:Carbohydrate-binding module 48 (Isoamylase N-terminal domain)